MSKRALVSAALVSFAVSLAGCAFLAPPRCPSGQAPAVQEVLYFGTDKPGGRVSAEDWAQFLSEAVTPRFPDGLTSWQASGQWRSASGVVIREPSYVLNLVHTPNDVSE